MNKDEELRERILSELRQDATIANPAEIGIAVRGGIVTLSGYVDSLIDAMAAEEIASGVPGVKGMVQNVRVRLPGGPGRDDQELVREACAALEHAPAAPQDHVTVVVDRGHVTLSGVVHWELHKDEAEAAVRGVPGVLGVTNSIVVRPPLSASDVKLQITRAFEKSVAHHVSHLVVEIAAGKVTLSGMVRAIFEKFEAERVVRELPGVIEVDNRLVVCPLAETLENEHREETGGPMPTVR